MTHRHRRPRITSTIIDAINCASDHQAANIEADPGAFSKEEIDGMHRLADYCRRLRLWFDDESRKKSKDRKHV